jgi:sulfide:quinone oxidoreductase
VTDARTKQHVNDRNGLRPKLRAVRSPTDRKVMIVGAGVAALEALLALRVHCGSRLEIQILAPGESFLYRPVSVAEAFDVGEAREFDLTTIFEDQRATRHVESLASVDTVAKTVRTTTGTSLPYDELIIARGAHPVPMLPGALTFRGRPDVPALREILRDLETGRVSRVVFALPTGNAWPLPMYELALMAAAFISARRLDARVLIVSSEEEPLELFGAHASEAISELLRARGIEMHLSALATAFQDGTLQLAGGATVRADRVVALPRLRGPAIPGLPCDQEGFIPVDVYGRVQGLEDVYAAGDATAFPLKQGGLAAQQADAIAEVIAQRTGAPVQPQPFCPVIRGLLLTGGAPIYLRAGPETLRHESTVANERGPETPVTPGRRRVESSSSSSALWWPPSKIAGRYLAPYLATARPTPLALAPLTDRHGQPRARASEAEHADALELALLLADYDARWGDHTMALRALDSAEALAGVLPPPYAAKRKAWQHALVRAGHRVRLG